MDEDDEFRDQPILEDLEDLEDLDEEVEEEEKY